MNRLHRIVFAHRYLMPDVELPGGIKVTMTDEQAATYTAARTKDKAEREEMAQRAGASKAAADAAEAAKKKAADDLALLEATKAGEIGKVREIAGKEANDKLAKALERTKTHSLRGAIASIAPTLDESSRGDILALIGSQVTVDPDTFELRFLDAAGQPRKNSDGTPVTADAGVREFLTARKHFQAAVIPPVGNGGGSGGGSGAGAPRKMTQAEYDATPSHARQQLSADIAAKKVQLEG